MNHNLNFGLKKRFGIIHSQIQVNMTELYKHSLIKGCIASKDIKKGTLIVSESREPHYFGAPKIGNYWDCYLILFPSVPKNQKFYKPVPKDVAREFLLSILESFRKMSKVQQEEYMRLPNKYNDVETMPESIMDLKYYESLLRSTNQAFDKKNLAIIAIYATNIAQCLTFNGVHLKMSQFHHSCHPNSVVLF